MHPESSATAAPAALQPQPEGPPARTPALSRYLPMLLALLAGVIVVLPNMLKAVHPEPALKHWRDASVSLFILLLPVLLGLRMRFWFRCCTLLVVLVPLVTVYYWSSHTMPAVWSLLALYEADMGELARFGMSFVAVLLATPLLLWFYWSGLTSRMTRELDGRSRGVLAALLLVPVPLSVLTGDTLVGAVKGALLQQTYDYPVGVALAFQRAQIVQSCFQARDSMDETFTAKAPPAKTREIHVLVIGESARFRAFQINGAKCENTPRLMSQKNLVSFQEAVAPSCMTGLSVPALVTPVTAENINEAASMPSIPAVFRKAGYSTWWLSSQRKHGVVDTRCSMYSRDAEHARFVSSKLTAQFKDYRTSHDGDLLPHLDEALASDSNQLFIVMHTMGSHSIYMDRYPSEFEKYPVDTSLCVEQTMKGIIPMPLMVIDTPEACQQLTNAYNNTICYTDWLLGEVISRLEKQTGAVASLTYISDHGENDAEAQVMPFCHGVVSPDTARVPMFVWTSPSYDQEHPEKVAALHEHQRTPFCSDTTFHSVIDLAGVECSLVDTTQSVAHPGFKPKPRLMVGLDRMTLIDFDKQILPLETGRKGWHRLTTSTH